MRGLGATHLEKFVPRPLESNEQRIRFRFDRMDLDGQWCPSSMSADELRLVLGKLREFETMKILDAFSGGYPGKDYGLSAIIPDARRRLAQLETDDIDSVCRLQITGAKRLYGIRSGNEFSILWWDPHHEICPSTKK